MENEKVYIAKVNEILKSYEQTFRVDLSRDVAGYEVSYNHLYQTQVADLDLSARSKNVLKHGGIKTLEHLVKKSEKEL